MFYPLDDRYESVHGRGKKIREKPARFYEEAGKRRGEAVLPEERGDPSADPRKDADKERPVDFVLKIQPVRRTVDVRSAAHEDLSDNDKIDQRADAEGDHAAFEIPEGEGDEFVDLLFSGDPGGKRYRNARAAEEKKESGGQKVRQRG